MTCGQKHDTAADILGGDIPRDMAMVQDYPTIGPYRLLARLGGGGMGEVNKVRTPSGEVRAVKSIHPHLVASTETMARFRREARLLMGLDHPHIVRAYDYSEQPPYLLMDYIEGDSLDKKIKQGISFSPAAATSIVSDIAEALDYAHNRGAIHRDVKPGNILLNGNDGRAMLTDFGLARLRQESLKITATDSVLGTPGYMSPEQAAGQTVDSRADIYALGVVAYEILTGRSPFKGDTPVAQLMNRLSESPTPPRQVRPDLPPAVERTLLRALARRPEGRFQSAGEFAAALRQAWQAPVETGPVSYSLPANTIGDGDYLLNSRDLPVVGNEGLLNLRGVLIPAARWQEAVGVFHQLGGEAKLSILPPDELQPGRVTLTRQGNGLNLQMVFDGESDDRSIVATIELGDQKNVL